MQDETPPPLSHQVVDITLMVVIRVVIGAAAGGLLGLVLVGTFDQTPGLDGAIHLFIGGLMGAFAGLMIGFMLALGHVIPYAIRDQKGPD
jgi:hypothetical protein